MAMCPKCGGLAHDRYAWQDTKCDNCGHTYPMTEEGRLKVRMSNLLAEHKKLAQQVDIIVKHLQTMADELKSVTSDTDLQYAYPPLSFDSCEITIGTMTNGGSCSRYEKGFDLSFEGVSM